MRGKEKRVRLAVTDSALIYIQANSVLLFRIAKRYDYHVKYLLS